MTKSILDMYKNLIQMQKLSYCKILARKRNYFAAELLLRDGKYIMRLDYYAYTGPKVYLLYPDIDMSNPLDIHTYGLKYHGSYKREIPLLCLAHPDLDKWDSSIPLIESYIPWAIEWTEFYEVWLLTGKWYGTGIHPGEEKNEE